MKRIIKTILAALYIFGAMFLTDITVCAETPNSPDDFGYYDYDYDKVLIEYYKGTSKKVVIPDTIDGKTVYAVTKWAFGGNTEVEEIYLPDTVEAVEAMAFSGCTNLKKIYLGSMKKPLDERLGFVHLLTDCPNLEWLGMSDEACFDLVSGGSEYFGLFYSDMLSHLKYIYLGNSMTNIDRKLFYGDGLEYVEIGSENPVYRSVSGVVYSADMRELVVCGAAYKNSYYEIPDGVEKIGTGFDNCAGIGRVKVPATVTEIGPYSFGKIHPVLEIRKDSYAEAWARRNGYETAYYGEPMPEEEKINIGLMDAKLSQVSYKYDGKEKKPEVTVKESEYEKLTEGEDYTVLYENNVKVGTAVVKVTGINSYTGTLILNFTIEEAIGEGTGDDGAGDIGGENTDDTDYTGNAGDNADSGYTQTGNTYKRSLPSKGAKLKDGKTKIVYVVTKAGNTVSCVGVMNKKAVSITIPLTVRFDGVTYKVTSVSANTFKNCKKLKKVTIGANVTSIGKRAFYGCKSLKTVTVKSKSIKKVGSKAFKEIHQKASIKVPKAKLKAYKKLLKKSGAAKSVKIKK